MAVRRAFLSVFLAALPLPALCEAADGAGWRALAQPGAIVLFRHADAPGTGDPPGFRLDDCATQRNLGEAGRAQARRIGEAFRQRGVRIGEVLASQWCRTRDTARLAFGAAREAPAFNSFFGGQGDEAAQTREARALLAGWRGPGVLAVVTHQVNITALTGVAPASGEGVVVQAPPGDGPLRVVARLRP